MAKIHEEFRTNKKIEKKMGNILEKNWKMEEIRRTNSEKLKIGSKSGWQSIFNRKLLKSLNYLEFCQEAKSFLFWGKIWDDFPKNPEFKT